MSIPCGPSALAIKEAAWGLARYASIAQVHIIVVIIIVNLVFLWSNLHDKFCKTLF